MSIVNSGKMQRNAAAYLAIARLDHSTKHIFIVPGKKLCLSRTGNPHDAPRRFHNTAPDCAICTVSANCVINEWIDGEFSKFYPTNSQRTAVNTQLSGTNISIQHRPLNGDRPQ